MTLPVLGLDTVMQISLVGRKEQVMTPALDVVRTALLGLDAEVSTTDKK